MQEILDLADREHALILQVVDGIHGLDGGVFAAAIVLSTQHHGDQAGLPVVAVQHVREVVQPRQHLQHRAGEEGEALALVAAQAVDVGAVEVVLVVDKVVGHACERQLLDAAVLVPPAQIDVKHALLGHLLLVFLGNFSVQRQYDAHVFALCRERLGQRAQHVGQAAGLDEGDAFGRRHQNFHRHFLH